MSVFEQIKDAVPIIEAARRYGMDVNRHGKARCIFHGPDKHPSLSFRDTYFKCFTCGETGDVFKLVQHLTGAQRPIDAAKLLNQDFSLGLDLGGTVADHGYKRDRDTVAAFEAWEAHACQVWAAYCQLLQHWQETCSPDDPRYQEACHRLDYADHIYHSIFISGSFADKARFYQTHKREVQRIEQLIRESHAA